MTMPNPGGPCILHVIFDTPGYENGTIESDYNVPDGTYRNPYQIPRYDLGYNPDAGQYAYELRCNGSQGIISFYATQTNTNVSIRSASNSCPGTGFPPIDAASYDCINGECKKSSGGKGYFKSLEDCQKICGFGGSCGAGKQCVDPNTFCPQGKICLEGHEYTEIQQIIAKISQNICS